MFPRIETGTNSVARPLCLSASVANALTNGGATQGANRSVGQGSRMRARGAPSTLSFYIAELLGAGALFEFAGKRHNGGHFVS